MRSLSFWAKHHPGYARFIIILSRCFLFLIAWFLGTQLSQSGIELSPLWICFFIAVFFVAGAAYPYKRAPGNYLKRKLCDLIIAICGFFMTLCFTNELEKPFNFYQTANATIEVKPSPYKYAEAKTLLEQFEKGEKTKFTAKEKRVIKKEFKYQLLQYAKAKVAGNKKDGEQAALILLTCIAAAGLLYLVAALACSISCNGSDAAAIIVLVLGTVGVIWGAVAIIRSIKRKRSKTK